MKPGFEALWNSILEDCGTESIPELKLRALAVLAGPEEMQFLLAEYERNGAEWQALIASGEDAGDGSDEYWRASVSLTKAFEYAGSRGIDFLRSASGADRLLSHLTEIRNR